MKNKLILMILVFVFPLHAAAQTRELDYTYLVPTVETGARLDANLQVCLVPKTLWLNFQEEIRFNDNFRHFHKSYTSAGIEYKTLPWLKMGAEYSFILNNSTSKGWGMRHRGSFFLTESIAAGRWKFSLRERFQATYKAGQVNTYQSPRTELTLKTRLKVSYDIPGSHFEPHISAEIRFLLNGVRPSKFVYNQSNGRWSNPEPEYSDAYLNRLRLKAGTQYKASKKSEFDFYLVGDLCYDLDIDLSSKGNQKTDTNGYADYLFVKNSYFIGFGISYTFKL